MHSVIWRVAPSIQLQPQVGCQGDNFTHEACTHKARQTLGQGPIHLAIWCQSSTFQFYFWQTGKGTCIGAQNHTQIAIICNLFNFRLRRLGEKAMPLHTELDLIEKELLAAGHGVGLCGQLHFATDGFTLFFDLSVCAGDILAKTQRAKCVLTLRIFAAQFSFELLFVLLCNAIPN